MIVGFDPNGRVGLPSGCFSLHSVGFPIVRVRSYGMFYGICYDVCDVGHDGPIQGVPWTPDDLPSEFPREHKRCAVTHWSDAALLTQRGREGALLFVMRSCHQLHGVLGVGENHRDGPLVLRSFNYANLRRHNHIISQTPQTNALCCRHNGGGGAPKPQKYNNRDF